MHPFVRSQVLPLSKLALDFPLRSACHVQSSSLLCVVAAATAAALALIFRPGGCRKSGRPGFIPESKITLSESRKMETMCGYQAAQEKLTGISNLVAPFYLILSILSNYILLCKL